MCQTSGCFIDITDRADGRTYEVRGCRNEQRSLANLWHFSGNHHRAHCLDSDSSICIFFSKYGGKPVDIFLKLATLEDSRQLNYFCCGVYGQIEESMVGSRRRNVDDNSFVAINHLLQDGGRQYSGRKSVDNSDIGKSLNSALHHIESFGIFVRQTDVVDWTSNRLIWTLKLLA